DEVKQALHVGHLPGEDADFHTLGGYLMARLNRVPMVADRVLAGGFRFEVAEMDGRRVDRVLVTPVETPGCLGLSLRGAEGAARQSRSAEGPDRRRLLRCARNDGEWGYADVTRSPVADSSSVGNPAVISAATIAATWRRLCVSMTTSSSARLTEA